MVTPRSRGAFLICILLGAAACGGDGGPAAPSAAGLSIVSGDNQTGFVGVTLSNPLTVQVTSSSGAAVSGVTVNFRVTTGTATLNPASAVTTAAGQAQTVATLGSSAGNIQITASVAGTDLTATFVEVAGTTTVVLACQSGSATLPAVSVVTSGLPGSGICLGGGTAGADYTLVAFSGSTVPGGISSIDVTGRGINLLSSAVATSGFDAAGGSMLGVTSSYSGSLQAAFDATLRLRARRALTPLMPGARQWQRSRARFNAIPSSVSVGQILRLNVDATSDDPCLNAVYHGARVVAITAKAIIMADTLNPPNGFTDAQYQSIGVTFDTLVDPLDRLNFGDPSDIDNNQRVVILYTRAVNELTPPHSSEYVGGFFYERDLFPTTATSTLDACAGSNVGEMFYMLAPDPTGVVNGNVRKTSDVQQITIGTVAHEYQHLINAAHRIFITDADFEEGWLNEGMSHIAEELLFYHVSGLSPRQNLTSAVIRSTTPIVNAFNEYESANFQRYQEFLARVPQESPYADNDSLATRGATWSLLRYLADHRGAADGDAWSKLVNSPSTGIANLKSVFGTDITTQIRNWATSIYADDVATATDAQYQQPSWNFRSVYTSALGISFPLKVTSLANGTPSTLLVMGGGVGFMRFTVAAGGQGSIDWTATGGAPVPPLMQWALVRTR